MHVLQKLATCYSFSIFKVRIMLDINNSMYQLSMTWIIANSVFVVRHFLKNTAADGG